MLHDLKRRRTPFTIAFVAFNAVVFLIMELLGGATDPATLMAFGAKSNIAIEAGEFWRFLTPVFIHIGLLHLVFNTYALWIVGQQVERLYGPARFVVLYVLMGIGGVVGSFYFNPESVSAGASGAIFGLFGVLLMFGIRNRKAVPAFLGRAIGAGVLPVILLNLLIGFAIPAIDNAAHVAGLVSGMALASVVAFQPPGMPTPRKYRVAQIVALAMVGLGFGQVAAHFEGPGATTRFIDAIDSAERALYSSTRAIRDGSDDLGRYADDVATAIETIQRAPSLADEPGRILSRIENVLDRQFAVIQEVRQTGVLDAGHRRELDEVVASFMEAIDELSDWVELRGGLYGLRLRNDDDSI